MKLVTILKGWNLTEARLACARLEAANFNPFLVNEYTAMMFGGIFPVRVQVPEVEAADAKEFLDAPATPAE